MNDNVTNSEEALHKANKLLQERNALSEQKIDSETERLMSRIKRQLSTHDLVSFGFAKILHTLLVLFSTVHKSVYRRKIETDRNNNTNLSGDSK